VPPIKGRLDETSRLGAPLYPVLGASDRWSDALTFSFDEWSVRVNTLAMTFEIVKTREAAFAGRVRAEVRFRARRVVRLNVGLRNISDMHRIRRISSPLD
jgi:hypothetical protein